MANYVIGNDKGLTPAYTKDEVDSLLNSKANQTAMNSAQNNITNILSQINTINSSLNAKQKTITSGTAAPTGGSNGDIYIQY